MEKNLRNKEGKKEGYWEQYYYINSKLHSKGNYKNGEREGYWEWHGQNGEFYKKMYFVV